MVDPLLSGRPWLFLHHEQLARAAEVLQSTSYCGVMRSKCQCGLWEGEHGLTTTSDISPSFYHL